MSQIFFCCWKKIALSICKLNKTKKNLAQIQFFYTVETQCKFTNQEKKTNTHTQREWQLRSNLVCHSSMIHIMIRTFNSNHHQQNIMSIRLLWIFWLLFFFFLLHEKILTDCWYIEKTEWINECVRSTIKCIYT